MILYAKIPHFGAGFLPASFLSMQVGAVGGIRTLEPLSGYTISSRARYDHFDTTATCAIILPNELTLLIILIFYQQSSLFLIKN